MITACLLASAFAGAAPAAAVPSPAKAGAAGGLLERASHARSINARQPVRVTGDRYTIEHRGESTLLEGHVRLTHASTILTCDSMRTLGNNDRATGDGHVHLVDERARMAVTAGHFEYGDRLQYVKLTQTPRFEHRRD